MRYRAYFDGSGNAGDVALALAGYVGPVEAYSAFEADWASVLEEHKCPISKYGTRYFHSREAFHRTEGFSGWSESELSALVIDLSSVIGKFGRPSGDLCGFSCVVDLVEYKRLNAQGPIPSLEMLCLDFAVGLSLRHPKATSATLFEIFFDRSEAFEPVLSEIWRRERRPDWCDRVAQISPVDDMRINYALQSADLLAWASYRYHCGGHNDQLGGGQLFTLAMLNPVWFKVYDASAIREHYAGDTMRGKMTFTSILAP